MNFSVRRIAAVIALPTVLLGCVLMLESCSNNGSAETVVGNWIKTTPFRGRPRSGSICFIINDKAYVGLGYDGTEYVNDFYEFDLSNGYWQKLADFPGTGRERAVAFSVNGKGYVGTGYNRDETDVQLSDFWVYNPATDAWVQKANFGGGARYNAVSFVLGDAAYVGTGYDGDYHSDFWRYDPTANTWTEIPSYPGDKKEEAIAFTVNGAAYVCTGRNNGLYSDDFWKFDAESNKWTDLRPDDTESYFADFEAAMQRHDAVAFTMNNKAYIACGVANGAASTTVYGYDPTSGVWSKKTDYEGTGRSLPVAFVIEDRAFVGTGQNGTRTFDDIWEFHPDETYNSKD